MDYSKDEIAVALLEVEHHCDVHSLFMEVVYCSGKTGLCSVPDLVSVPGLYTTRKL